MSNYISSRTDLITYIADTHSDVEDRHTFAKALQAAEHPAYGADWQDWLDRNADEIKASLPEAQGVGVARLTESAADVTAASTERDEAIDEETRAAAALLTLIVDLVRPTVRAIGDSLPALETVYGVDGQNKGNDRRRRYVPLVDAQGPHKLWLRDDGVVCESEYVRSSTGGDAPVASWAMKEYASPLAALEDGWNNNSAQVAADDLAKLLDKAAPGLKSRAAKARANAAKLRAVAELLRK